MTDNVANLNLKVDATSVDAGVKSLKDFKAAGREAQTSSEGFKSATQEMADAIRSTEAAFKAEFVAQKASATQTLEHAKAAHSAASATGAMREQIRMSAEDFRKMTQAQGTATETSRTLAEAQRQINEAIRDGRPISAQAIKDAGGFANAMKIMEQAHTKAAPAIKKTEEHTKAVIKGFAGANVQMSTFVRELLVLGREAGRGDFNRMAGSATILAQAMGGVELLMNPYIAGFVAITAAVAGAVLIHAEGSREMAKLQNSMTVTGNYAGMTAGKFEEMATRTANATNSSIRSNKEAIGQLVASGKFQSDTIEIMVDNAQRFSKYTGQSAVDIVKDYETMKGGVVRWAVKHSEVYHDLTFAQIEYIDKLEKAGKHAEAEKVLMQDISDNIKNRMIPQYGYLQKALHDVGKSASDMWDKILGWGRPKTIDQQLEEAKNTVNQLNSPYNQDQMKQDKNGKYYYGERAANATRTAIANAKARVADLEKQKAAEQAKADADAKKAQEEDDKIRKKFDNGGFRPMKKDRTPIDKVGNEIADLKAQIEGNRDLADAYDMSTAAGFRAAAAKKALITAARLHTDASKFEQLEIDAAVTKSIADGYKSLAQDKERIGVQTQVNQLMRDKGISMAEAQQIAKDQLEIDRLQAAADNASGQDKTKALSLIAQTKAQQAEKNRLDREAWTIAATNDQKGINADLDVQLSLMNATNRERNEALATMQAKRDLEKQGVHDFGSEPAKAFIAERVKTANKQTDLQDGVGDVIKKQQFYLQLVDKMQARTRQASQDMASAFGSVGESIAKLSDTMSQYSVDQKQALMDYTQAVRDADGDQEKISALKADRDAAQRDSTLKYYGDMTQAASSFFGKNTAAYKAMHAAEMAFRAVEFANTARSMYLKAAEVIAHVTGEGTKAAATTASGTVQVASNTAVGVSAAAAGVANQALGDPYTAFARMAAMAAAMAALGFAVAGMGGKAKGVNDVKAIQANQGAGSVFGDKSAKSESIANSLEQAQRNQNQMLEYNSDMVRSLHNIENSLGAVTNTVIRMMNGGSLDPSNFNVGSSKSGPSTLSKLINPVAMLFPGLFGSKTTTNLTDQGLNFNDQSLSDLIANGVNGNNYAQTVTTKKKKLFGATLSSKSSTNNYSSAFDDDLSSQISLLVKDLRDGVVSAATALGIDGAKATLDAFTVSIGQVSFKDMTGEEISSALSAIFSKVGDEMATAIVPTLTTYQKAGEGMMETLVRVARDFQVVGTSLTAIGKPLKDTTVASLGTRESLIKLFGTLDDFVSATDFYQQNFLTEAEQLAPVQAAVTKEMTRLGVGAVTTKEQFKSLVNGLDLTTTGGQEMFAALMKIAPAFDKVATSATEAASAALEAANDLVDKATNDLLDAYKAQSEGIQDTIDRLTKVTDALRKYNQQLETGPEAMLSPQDQYFATKAQFEDTYAKAQGGDQDALDNLQTVSQAYLEASKNYYASTGPYFQDLRRVKDAISNMVGKTQTELDVLKKQQETLDKLVNETLKAYDLNVQVRDGVVLTAKNVLTVNDAISALGVAITAQAKATSDLAAAQTTANAQAAQQIADAIAKANQTPSTTSPTTPANDNATPRAADWNSYLAHYPDVVEGYGHVSQGYLHSLGINSMQDYAAWHFAHYGKSEGRTPYAKGGLMTRPITLGESGIGGEAGPEGILPLANVNGRLGVAATQDTETKELLKQVVTLLNGANQQRAIQAQQAEKSAKELRDAADAQKRAIRAKAS